MMHFFDRGFYMGFGGIGMIFWWVLIIAIVVGLLKWLAGEKDSTRDNTAIDILKERYARGEIDQTEFERMRKELGN